MLEVISYYQLSDCSPLYIINNTIQWKYDFAIFYLWNNLIIKMHKWKTFFVKTMKILLHK